MPIARVQYDQAQTAGASPLNFAPSPAPTAGNLLVIMGGGIQSGSPGFDAAPAGWTEAYRDPDKFIHWKISDGTESPTISVTFTTGANDCRGYFVEYSGAETLHTFGLGTWTSQVAQRMGPSKVQIPGCAVLIAWSTHSTITTATVQNNKGYTILPDSTTRNEAWERIYPATFPIEDADPLFQWGGDGQSGKYVAVAIKPSDYVAPNAPISYADTLVTRQIGQTKYA